MARQARARSWWRLLTLLVVVALAAAACGGGGDDDSAGGGGGDDDGGGNGGQPVRGGRVVYGLEAETTGGWCLQEAQLAISGIQVARTIYDQLTIPNENGEYVPYLAKAVKPNGDYTKWTIKLRPNVVFHDGSKLTAEVVKNNLDAYRGTYANRSPLLFVFVFDNIADTKVVDDLTLEVTTKSPWPAFPAYLWANGRVGITAQKQLDSEDCATDLIGTGPFQLKDWKVNDRLVAERNENYWQEGLPYLDEIEYRPITEATQRVNALQGGELQLLHTASALAVSDLRALEDTGDIALIEGDQYAEVGYVMLNAAKPPFDNLHARQAMAYATDRDTQNEVRNKGVLTNASGPFAPGAMGYLEDTGFPEFDLDAAREHVQAYEDETGEPLRFTYSVTPPPESVESAQLLKQMWEEAGMEVDIKTAEQSQLINDAIGNNFQAVGWRLHPGGDPDLQWVWWHSGSPVNFGKFADTEIDRLLEEGRAEADPAKRTAIYEDLNRRFAEQLYDIWEQWTLWVLAYSPEVHGVLGADLPDGTGPFPGLADGHSVTGIWVDQ